MKILKTMDIGIFFIIKGQMFYFEQILVCKIVV